MFVGAPRGRPLPFAGRWGEVDVSQVEHSHLIMHLCNRLKEDMCIYRRGAHHGLFAFYVGLYESVYPLEPLDKKGCVRECVEAACRRYPVRDEAIGHAIFLSSRKRSAWNITANAQRAAGRTDAIRVKCERNTDGEPMDTRGSSAHQSDMMLWPGVELIGCTRGGSSQKSSG